MSFRPVRLAGENQGSAIQPTAGIWRLCSLPWSAQISVVGPDGERTLPLKRLYTHKGKKPLSLRKGEILKEILIPSPAGTTLYLKWRLRDSIEFPMISLAVHLEKNGEGKIKRAKIVFSGIGPGPVEAPEVEKMLVGADLE